MPDLARVTEQAAASLRAPLRGEILPITVTTESRRFAVPAEWLGRLVRFHADGGDVYIQVSTDTLAACDRNARAQESGDPIMLTPSASGNGCMKIGIGMSVDLPIPSGAQTFALQGSDYCCARCHLAET